MPRAGTRVRSASRGRCAAGDVEDFGNLLRRQAGEIAQLDHARSALVGLLQLRQRLFERERLLCAFDGRLGIRIRGERDLDPVAAGLLARAA